MTLSDRGARLREDRQRQGLSLYKTAVKAGVHPNSVMLAERGATSERTLERIEVALGIARKERKP